MSRKAYVESVEGMPEFFALHVRSGDIQTVTLLDARDLRMLRASVNEAIVRAKPA